MSTFVDTSAFYAFLDAADQQHAQARDEWGRLLERREGLYTTNYVLVETMALLQARFGIDAVRVFTADVLPVVNVLWIDEALHRSAHHALLIASRRDLSLADCSSFEAMHRQEIGVAFCFDPHFVEQGFTVVPAADA